ncbi:MAG: YbaN family protein [Thermoplasmata archaeon]|nr:YbaN family protein [Thermoplasmata archaeon]
MKPLILACGFIFVGLGVIGIVLPVLPTTPFLLLAAFCFARSSEKWHNWLMTNKLFGDYLRNYQEGRGIPLKVKVMAITFLWVTILISIFFFLENWILEILLIAIASAVTIHIISVKTCPK